MRESFLPIEQILTILAANPPRIAALTAGLSPAQLHAGPEPGAWSASDILAHLRACADVWGGNIKRMVAEDVPTWRGISPRAWIKKTDYLEQEFRPALEAFTRQRADLLALLESLPQEDWERRATVIDMIGKPLERTVLDYADGLTRHERSHVKQIERILNKMRS